MNHTCSETPSPSSITTDASSVSSASETQLRRFYRLWCLKESVAKALGQGFDFDHRSVEFTIQDEEETNTPILSTMVEVHEPTPELLPEEAWSFEEALLDSEHCYAIAAQTEMEGAGAIMDGTEIRRLTWDQLLKDAVSTPIQHL
ncbi:hypothetical protein BGZ94_002865 [Podila epigama]|nr:hypothetical protein BGZ94_002865 [Podila epigama]